MKNIIDDINSNKSNFKKSIKNNKENKEIHINNNNDIIDIKTNINNSIEKFKFVEPDKKESYKISLVGYPYSGKSCFVYRIQADKFNDNIRGGKLIIM